MYLEAMLPRSNTADTSERSLLCSGFKTAAQGSNYRIVVVPSRTNDNYCALLHGTAKTVRCHLGISIDINVRCSVCTVHIYLCSEGSEKDHLY